VRIDKHKVSKEVAVTKKVWRKPEVRAILAGSAESSNKTNTDGATKGNIQS
jgi:hypothetical protein